MDKGKWFIDSDGDLGLLVDGCFHVFYKWHDSTVVKDYKDIEVTFLDDANSKDLWRKVKAAVEEFKKENIE